jgi:hypothetical protein
MDSIQALQEELNWLRGQRDELVREREQLRGLLVKTLAVLDEAFELLGKKGPAALSQPKE